MEGNLQQLAAMVRGNARRPEVPAAAPVPQDVLPDSTMRVARGLSSETVPPMREDEDVDAFLASLAQDMRDNPAQAIQAQGLLHEGTVRNLT